MFQPLEVGRGARGCHGLLKSLLWLYFYFDGNKIHRKLSKAWGAPIPRPGICPEFWWMRQGRGGGGGLCLCGSQLGQGRLAFSSSLWDLGLGREGQGMLWREIRKWGG